MRPDDLFSKPSSAVLDAPEEVYAPAASRRRSRQPDAAPRRDFGKDFAGSLPDTHAFAEQDGGFDSRTRRGGGLRFRFSGGALQVPRTLWGRIVTGVVLLLLTGAAVVALLAVRSFFLHDPRFVVASSSSIQTVGNTHLTRAQLLSVFGEDVERNIFSIPLAQRRIELESLPWVQHATLMRLLPNHLRIAIVERTPAAFVRQGTQIGMVDANGVLLDMPPDAPGDPLYSFPVVTGINSADPLSTRAARMKLYTAFTTDLDSTAEHISGKLSEVDLANPEDIKALIPDGASDLLVHFGDTDFLARYRKYQQHLQEWRTQYPRLASVDMRYERQVVLEMVPTSTAVVPQSAGVVQPKSKLVVKAAPATNARAPRATSPPALATGPTASHASAGEWHMVVVKPHAKGATAPRPTVPTPSQTSPQ